MLWGDILGTLFVCMMFCWFSFQDGFLRYVTRHSIVFREIFFYRAIVSYAVALILVLPYYCSVSVHISMSMIMGMRMSMLHEYESECVS